MLKLLAAVAMILGLTGILACGVGAYAAWRVERAAAAMHEQVFAQLDRLLVRTSDYLRAAQQRALAVQVNGREFEASIRAWGARLAAERLAATRDLERRTEHYKSQLRLAQGWVELSQHGVLASRQFLQLSEWAGNGRTSSLLEQTEETLQRLDAALKQLTEAANRITAMAANRSDPAHAERIEAVRVSILNALAAVHDADHRLMDLDRHVAEWRADARALQTGMEDKLRWAFYGCVGVLGWVALGQAALVLLGGRGLRGGCQNQRSASATMPTDLTGSGRLAQNEDSA